MKNRFQFFRWPLDMFEEPDGLRKDDFPLDPKSKSTKYPIRAIRYWWAVNAVLDELRSTLKRPLILSDAGIDRGIFKRLLPKTDDLYVIGMDLEPSLKFNAEELHTAHFNELKPCDLDQKLPLDDESVDISVCLHVLEHLPRPEFALSELNRILKPGGLMLLGFPVKPKFFAKIREKQFAKDFASYKRTLGRHQHSFWPSRTRKMIKDAGLELEFMAGSWFIRKRGAWWENSALWMRFNQLWGTLFPSLGQELCLKIRKPPVQG